MRSLLVCLWAVASTACGAPAPLPLPADAAAEVAANDIADAETAAPADSAGEAVASPDAAETVPAVDSVADLTAPADSSATADASTDVTPADAVADAVLACSPDCPQAVLDLAGAGAPVIPQSSVKPSCSSSIPSCGAQLAKCLWTVKTPNGDQTVELPPGQSPAFALNQAGQNKICLDVVDTAGKKSCAQACFTVLVIPTTTLHIELTWKTPTDPDPWDSGPAAGADLDLHFAHPLALGKDGDCDGNADPWFSNPWDTFWYNSAPEWGGAGNTKDNPTLDLDDADGAGPENLNLFDPEGTAADTVAYAVGVHYWNDHGYGNSTAAVAVYVQGGLVFKASQSLSACDMWYVGKLNWPNTGAGGAVPAVKPCYQTGLSCPAGKNLMWAPAGDGCVTPKYGVPKVFPGVGGC